MLLQESMTLIHLLIWYKLVPIKESFGIAEAIILFTNASIYLCHLCQMKNDRSSAQ